MFFSKKSKKEAVARNIDQEIYDAVFSAQDILAKRAERLEQLYPGLSPEEEQNLRLYDLGFTKTVDIRDTKLKKEMRRLLDYVGKEYPLYKYITKKDMREVCEKYSLYLRPVCDYKDAIPDKNKKEILNFKVKAEDIRKPREVGSSFFDFPKKKEGWDRGYYLLIAAPEEKLSIPMLDMLNKLTKEQMDFLQIDKRSMVINDPIVLQPVFDRGVDFEVGDELEGYLIITAWGLEAADEKIKNPKMN